MCALAVVAPKTAYYDTRLALKLCLKQISVRVDRRNGTDMNKVYFGLSLPHSPQHDCYYAVDNEQLSQQKGQHQ